MENNKVLNLDRTGGGPHPKKNRPCENDASYSDLRVNNTRMLAARPGA